MKEDEEKRLYGLKYIVYVFLLSIRASKTRVHLKIRSNLILKENFKLTI